MNKLDKMFLRAKSKVNQVVNPVRHAEIREKVDIMTDRMHRRGEISFYYNDKGKKMVKFEYAQLLKNNAKDGWVRLLSIDENEKPVSMYEINDESLAYIDVLVKEAGEDAIKDILGLMYERKCNSEDPWGIELAVDQETNTFKVFADKERSEFI